MMSVNKQIHNSTKECICPNSSDGVHRGVSSRSFGDGCCTCGKYIIFNENKPLLDLEGMFENHYDQIKQFPEILAMVEVAERL